jgi:hypothetical protein
MELTYSALKARQREIRHTFSESLALRTHRSLSWLDRAERETGDTDAKFIFLWIAFNAAYAHEIPDKAGFSERRLYLLFFRKLVELDREKLVYKLLWENFSGPIRLLIENEFVFRPYWEYRNGRYSEEEWLELFGRSKASAKRALARMNSEKVMAIAFDRLYVLRNQILHGGATWNSSVNRRQVNDGARFLERVVPLLVHLMMENPDATWGEPTYPVVSLPIGSRNPS